MSKNTWYKYKKKLVEPKDYMLIDGTEDDDAKLSSFTNCVTMDQFNPSLQLTKAYDKDDYDDILDYDRVDSLEEKFFHGVRLRSAILATVSGLLQNSTDINIFVVLRPKVFKYFAKKIRREFIRRVNVDFEYVVVFGKKKTPADYHKELRYRFTDMQLQKLEKELRDQEKQMEKEARKNRKKRR